MIMICMTTCMKTKYDDDDDDILDDDMYEVEWIFTAMNN